MIESLIYAFFSIIITFIFFFVIVRLSRNTEDNLSEVFGLKAFAILGFFGIIIHELSHLVAAIIFRHRIDSVRLWSIPKIGKDRDRNNDSNADNDSDKDNGVADSSTESIGYVYHSWYSGSLYQIAGNTVIGVAPIIGSTVILLLITNLLTPGLIRTGGQATNLLLDTNGVFQPTEILPAMYFLGNILSFKTDSPVLLILAFLLTFSISLGGFAISDDDISHIPKSLPVIIIFVVLVTILFSILGQEQSINYFFMKYIVIIAFLFIFVIIALVITNLFLRVLYVFK